jgi:ABC-type bacteriocin/lantibiotic exporter with double-glycine peptidase domain
MTEFYQHLKEAAKSLHSKEETKFDFASSKRLLPYIKPYRKKLLLGAGFMLALSLLALPPPYLLKLIFDKVLPTRNSNILGLIILVLLLIQLIRAAIAVASRYQLDTLNQEVVAKIKRELFYRILTLPLSFFDKNQSAYLLSRIGEVEGLSFFLSSALLGVLVSMLEFVFCLCILFSLNLKLTVVTLAILPLFFLAAKFHSRGIRKFTREAYERGATVSRRIQDSIAGVDVIKSFGAEKREADRIQSYLNESKEINIKRNLISSFSSEALSLAGALGGFIVLWLGGLDIINNTFTLGSYMAFSAYIGKLYGPTQVFANMGLAFQPARVALDRIMELMRLMGEEEDEKAIKIDHIKKKIEFRNVYFSYDTHSVLFDLSFQVNKGDKVLLSGPNGSGKSTIIKLLLGLYKVKSGSILIDDHDISEISLPSLRQQFSIVSQNTFLFNDTIRNNILYSRPDATETDICEATRMAGAQEFIQNLERGIRLSGGEKQKISIARAVLKDSSLVIFDEATTHLDAKSEERINALIQNKFSEKTCIMISHRVREIPGINRAYYLNEGRIIRDRQLPNDED